jgi:dTDP-4-amino-4,6-dideoxygalactose transaminase
MSAKMNIPFFNYPSMFAEREDEYTNAITSALKRGAYIMQSDLLDFERDLASYCGTKYAFGVADGTVALTLALRLAEVGPGDEVIVPSHTFVATAAAVHHVGGTPVLCDCLPDHMIDVDSARRMVTKKTKAIMPVQLNGRTCNMDDVCALADEFDLKIVEDSCQALGAKFRDKHAGTFGVAGSFSFYPSKTLGSFGDGGAIILDDDASAQTIQEYRDHGRNAETGKVHRFGHNSRLDNIQAAVLNIKLKYYEEAVEKRRALARIYDERLKGHDRLLLPPGPDDDNLRRDIFQNYEIEADQRDDLRNFLAERGVGTIIQWGGFLIHQFEKLELKFDAPYAEKMSSRYMMLPMHHMLTSDEVHYVCDTVLAFYKGQG